MRKILAFIVLTFCVMAMCGQKYVPYLIITKSGDKIECLAQVKKDYITYRLGASKEKVRLYSSEVKYAANIEGDTIYNLLSGMPVYNKLSQTSATNVGWIRFLTDPRTEPVSIYVYYTRFLNSIRGNYGCYRQGDDFGQDLFTSATLKSTSKENLSTYFSDCPSVVEYINSKDVWVVNFANVVNVEEFKNIVTEYNQCVK